MENLINYAVHKLYRHFLGRSIFQKPHICFRVYQNLETFIFRKNYHKECQLDQGSDM